MTVPDKGYRILAMAMKAGGVGSGETAAAAAVRKGNAYAVVIARDASRNTKKKFMNSCQYYGVPCIVYGTKDQLGRCIGKENRSVLAVTNESLAGALIKQTGRNVVDGEN